MCTVLIAWKRVAGWPLVVGNNRDEFFARRALPPRVYRAPENGRRRWLASFDLAGGGSWWGWNDQRLMVWLTNRWTDGREELAASSRGELVLKLLRHATAAEARQWLEEGCRPARYNPFNVMVASADRLFFAANFPKLHFVDLEPGFHFLGNGRLLDCPSLKARSARRLLAELESGDGLSGRPGLELVLDRFRRALATPLPQDTIPPQGFNVRFADYGTSASLLMACPAAASIPARLAYCEGNPLYHPYQDYSGLAALL